MRAKSKSCAIAACVQILNLFAGQTLPADSKSDARTDSVKVAAVQISGYDKGDVPREGYDPTDTIVSYVHRAGKDNAQLVVFPEYVLGRIPVPGPATRKLGAAAKENMAMGTGSKRLHYQLRFQNGRMKYLLMYGSGWAFLNAHGNMLRSIFGIFTLKSHL